MSPLQLGAAVVIASFGIASLAALMTPVMLGTSPRIHKAERLNAGNPPISLRLPDHPVRQIPLTQAEHRATVEALKAIPVDPPKLADRVELSPGELPARAVPIARIAPPALPATTKPADQADAPAGSAGDPEPEPEPEPKRRLQRNSTDICARTGGRKITTHGGKSWRCAYSRHG